MAVHRVAQMISEYRKHAAAQRVMVNRRNRQEQARTGSRRWTGRSLLAYEQHSEAMADIVEQLHFADLRDVAKALTSEAHALSQLAWRRMSGKADDHGQIEYALFVSRRTIRATVKAL